MYKKIWTELHVFSLIVVFIMKDNAIPEASMVQIRA